MLCHDIFNIKISCYIRILVSDTYGTLGHQKVKFVFTLKKLFLHRKVLPRFTAT